MKTKQIFFIFVFMAMQATRAWGWSSTDFLYTPFQTHEYFNQMAYEELEKHPAFKKSKFPSLADIQTHSIVTKSRTGLGPDGSVNSYYSFHWYNPRTGLGNAPAAAQAYYDRLIASFKGETPAPLIQINGIKFNDPHVEPAHSAAYAAHYTQDMTCSFHVIGMPASDMNPDRVASNTVNGPFRNYSLDDWQYFTNRFILAKANDHLIDWFDVTYWDGNRPYIDMRSSHFLYEGLVEMAFKNAKSAGWMIEFQHKGFIHPNWKTNESLKERVTGLSERMALLTRNSLDTNANGARFDTVQFQKDLEIGMGTITGSGPISQVQQALGKYIKVPYADWWAAIQATYCVWRSALCALWMEETDIEMLRMPGEKDRYKLRVVVQNLEKEASAKDVKVEFSFKNGPSAKGDITVGTVDSNDGSLFKDSQESFHLTPESRSKGILTLRVTGRYDNIPDLGVFTKEFDVKNIRLREFAMPKLTLLTREEALKIAQNDPYHFKVDVDSSKEPEKGNLAGVVYSQEPVPGAVVAEHEQVRLRAYADYYVSVPGVIGMTEKGAVALIEAVDLRAKPAKVDVPHDQPDGIVLEQNPGKDAKARPRTDVVISISRRLPPPKKPDVPVVQAPQPKTVTPQQLPIEPEPPLRELQVSPSGATIEVGQSVGLTAVPIALFPERPVTNQVVAGMSFQWFANLPGFASVGGGGRSASVTGLKPGTVSIYCVTEQAMGLATIIIVEPKDKKGNSVSSTGGFKDSSDEWKTETKDSGSNLIPDAPPLPPSRGLFSNDPFANQFPDVPKPPPSFTGPAPGPTPGIDPAYEQQLLYEEQLRQQQAYYDELQRQQQLMNVMGGMINMMTNPLQQPQNPNNRNIQPPPVPNTPPVNQPTTPPKTGIKPNPQSPPTVSSPVEGGGGNWRGQTGPRNSATGQPVQNNNLNLLNQTVEKPVHTGSFGNCPKCGKTLIGGPACICGWKK